MPHSLYQATVGAFLQTLPAVAGFLVKAENHCTENGLPAEALTSACLAPDMWPFAKQISALTLFSAGAIEGVRAGVSSPNMELPPLDFASLHSLVANAITSLEKADPDEINGLAGRDMRFAFSSGGMDFVAEDYLLSFAVPNFYFHSAAAYNILRNKGLDVGKRDFLGRPRLKG